MRVITYCRVSSDEQARSGVVIEAQRQAIELYAQLYEHEIVERCIDEGYSAKSLRRPALKRALKALEGGQADGLVVYGLDRLTRSVRDLAELLDGYFGQGKYALLAVREQVDTSTAAGRMVLNVVTSISQWEREKISERMQDFHRVKKARGERTGRLPYGSTPQEAEIVASMREMRAAGATYEAIASNLNDKGVQAKAGRWYATSVRRVLERAS